MAGYEQIGPVIGTNEVFGTNILTVTLTDDAPRTTPDNFRALMCFIATSEPSANAPTDIFELDSLRRVPTVTDSLASYVSPYYSRENGERTTSSFVGLGLGPFVVTSLVSGGTTTMLRYAGHWVLWNALEAGDTITFDFTHLPTTLDWLSVNVHLATNFPRPENSYTRLSLGFTGFRGSGGGWTSSPPSTYYSPARWCQLVSVLTVGAIQADNTFTIINNNLTDDINFSTQYIMDYSGRRIQYGFQEKDNDLGNGTLTITMPGTGTFGIDLTTGGDYYQPNFPTFYDSESRWPGYPYDNPPPPVELLSMKRIIA